MACGRTVVTTMPVAIPLARQASSVFATRVTGQHVSPLLPAYVSIRQHASACVHTRVTGQQVSPPASASVYISIPAYVSIRQDTWQQSCRSRTCVYVCVCVCVCVPSGSHVTVGRAHSAAERLATHLTIRAHTSAYVSVYSMRQHTSADVCATHLLPLAPKWHIHIGV